MARPSSTGLSSPTGGATDTGTLPGADVGREQLLGDGLPEHLVHVAKMPPEQLVELEIVVRRVVVAIPPEPVAAFGDQHLLERAARDRPGSAAAADALEHLAGLAQLPPGPQVVARGRSR